MRRKELVPLKRAAEAIGVSRTSLWRARQCAIADFPEPVLVGRLIYWRRADIPKLDEAMLRYEGRGAFEKRRDHARKVRVLSAKRTNQPKRKHAPQGEPDPAQQDLF